MLSQAIQVLSVPRSALTGTGSPQVRPPLVERLTIAPAPFTAALSGSEAISHTPSLRSKATDGSLTRAKSPVPDVMPGSEPCVQVTPLSVEVANPMSEAPPSKKRPCWNAETIVEPFENVSGSTSVACWLVLLLNGSELIIVSVTFAAAGTAPTATAARAAPAASHARRARTGKNLVNMSDPSSACRHAAPWPPCDQGPVRPGLG